MLIASCATKYKKREINETVMQEIYNENQNALQIWFGNWFQRTTPIKWTARVFSEKDGKWFMTYLIYDGRGYETWLAESDDLLHWKHLGKVMSFSQDESH